MDERGAVDSAAGEAIAAQDLSVTLGGRAVLHRVNLALGPGSRTALLGRNGAGKTTLLRALAGLLRPTRGAILIFGRPFAGDPLAARRLIGVVGHQPYVYPELTVAENLVLYARLYGVRSPRQRVTEVLELVGLQARRAEPAATLSRGLLQRLALARAIVHDPPVLLLDEPDAGLDQRGLDVLGELLRSDEPRQRTVLLTTHLLEHAARFADEIVVLHEGRIAGRFATAAADLLTIRERYARLIGDRVGQSARVKASVPS